MSVHDLLQGLAERMGASADIKTIFGEPIAAEGKTIIPVARLAYGLGTGFGTRTTIRRAIMCNSPLARAVVAASMSIPSAWSR